MSDRSSQVVALLAGVFIGGIFFGGLWLTVPKIVSSTRPALWFLGSLLARSLFALGGFYFASDRQWDRLLLCLCGFFVSRTVVIRFTRNQEHSWFPGKGANRAP